MKNKLIIWGTNAENERILIALELQADTNKVMLYTFPEAVATEEFAQKMMHEWRDDKEVVSFPADHTVAERELSVTESLLPDDIKTDRMDLLQRAQTEWHFAVLSAKLHSAYKQELADFKEKVASLSDYDNKTFIGLRTFWDKVQSQSRERNLYRPHADELRDGINALFEQLKEVRKKLNSEFMEVSQNVYEGFVKVLDEVDERIASGGSRFNSVFDELKKIQREYHNTRMSNEHRSKLWDRLDAAFKKAKERKFGPEVNAGSIADRHDKRLSGLEDAVKRLEDSLRRDDEELVFQRKKVNTSEGQLEAQIRSAKIKMIEERATGKRERLAELTKARNDVQRAASSAHDKEARAAAKEAERQQIAIKKAAIKSQIEAETHAKAAAASHAVGKEDSLFEAATNVLGDALLNALDTVKAVASVVTEKAEAAFDQVMDKSEEALESYNKSKEAAKAEAPVMATEAVAVPLVAEPVAEKPAKAAKAPVMATEAIAEAVVAEKPAKAAKAPGKPTVKVVDKNKPTKIKPTIIIDDVVHKSIADADSTKSDKNKKDA